MASRYGGTSSQQQLVIRGKGLGEATQGTYDRAQEGGHHKDQPRLPSLPQGLSASPYSCLPSEGMEGGKE